MSDIVVGEPIISVIIPTYRPQDYVKKCLSSLASQTIRETFEILIILNGEKNPYYGELLIWEEEILKNISSKIIYTDQKGVSNARNIGLSHAKGNYIVFVDDDDYVSEFYLERLYHKFNTVKNVDIVQSNFKADVDGDILNDYISRAYDKLRDIPFSIFTHRKFMSSVCGKMFTYEFIEGTAFQTSLSVSEDAMFLFETSRKLKKLVCTDPDSIYFRNVRPGSSMRAKRSKYKALSSYGKKFILYSLVYFRNPFQYNFWFFMSRLAAITKVLIIEMRSEKLAV